VRTERSKSQAVDSVRVRWVTGATSQNRALIELESLILAQSER
jgi:hypothetical protein